MDKGQGLIREHQESIRVSADHFATGFGAEGHPGDLADRTLDEPDRSVAHQHIGTTGVGAGCVGIG